MSKYFYVWDDVLIRERALRAEDGDQALYDVVEEMVRDKKNPCNGIPYSIEVDGWGELATIGERYETPEFIIECISEEEYENF